MSIKGFKGKDFSIEYSDRYVCVESDIVEMGVIFYFPILKSKVQYLYIGEGKTDFPSHGHFCQTSTRDSSRLEVLHVQVGVNNNICL